MASRSRSGPTNWLLGKPQAQLSAARLPRALDVLRLVQFHHLEKGKPLAESYTLACSALLHVWERARIPTQRLDACVRQLTKLNERYLLLKKNRTRGRESDHMKAEVFKNDLEELFDVSTKDALNQMKDEEDRDFFRMQRVDVFSCSMRGSDMNTAKKERKKREREEKTRMTKVRYEQRESRTTADAPTIREVSVSSEEQQSEGEEFQPPGPSKPKRTKTAIFKSKEVVQALDRVNLSDNGAVFVAGAVAKALGHDLTTVTISRSSIRRNRRECRKEAAAADEASTPAGPYMLHWDSKLMPSIDGSKETVDRLAILVTGNGEEKLLGIPKIASSTGEAQANACIDAIQKWGLTKQIRGLVFDTTASNTGTQQGAATRVEKELGKELVWAACRHHVMEIMLSDVFAVIFGPTGGPEIGLFKRFQKAWSKIDRDNFSAAEENRFQEPVLKELRRQMLEYLPKALQDQQPRDDYQEFLTLSLLFLGGGDGGESIRAPGPMHRARWMSKGIYAIKLFLFRDQFTMTAKESQNITRLALFVSLIYIRVWNEAPLGIRAPNNDIQLLALLQKYPDQAVATTARAAMARHLWYLSEHLVALAFFDDRVTDDVKLAMVKNLDRPPKCDRRRRTALRGEKVPKLEDQVTKRTASFFDNLSEGGHEMIQSVLKKPPTKWNDDPVFRELSSRASKMKVVNDSAERAISLMERYNESLTKDEEQKQLIVRLMANHRKRLPKPSKAALMS